MNPDIQKKIDRISELVRQRDAVDRELAAILGVNVQPVPVVVPTDDQQGNRVPVPVRKCGACGRTGHTYRTCEK